MKTGEILDGRYEITAALGAGGMGEIYKATHTLLGAPRVIKVIHSRIASNTDARDRFFREARVATKVQHQNVATLYDFASLPDGSHYMVWEFIDGENLAQRLRVAGTLPPRQSLRIAIQALHGLEAIHRAGIIHRDISPENLMITRDDVVKIIDLGVAKLEDPDAVSQTRTGIFVGKLRYAAPEQLGFLPEGEKVDGRADLYAMAMVVVELLTGRPPYEAKSPHEYFLHHAKELPTSTIELPPMLPGGTALQRVLQKALARDRNERYASAHDFAAALEEILASLPDPVSQPTMAVPLDGDATWRPSPVSQTAVTQAGTGEAPFRTGTTPAAAVPVVPLSSGGQAPLPVTPAALTEPGTGASAVIPMAAVPPPPPVLTPLPRKRGFPVALLVAFIALLVVAGAAYALWPAISQVIAPSKPKPVAAAPKAVAPSRGTITVTPPVTQTTSTVVAAVVPPTTTTTTTGVHDDPTLSASRNDGVRPPERHPRAVPLYVDGPGRQRHSGNERALDRLRDELHGVHEVALLGGGQQMLIYRAMHRYIPDLTFDAEAPIVIRWDANRERLGYDRQDLAGSATITKDGRVIFRYDIPSGVSAETAADAFAQTLADAFQ